MHNVNRVSNSCKIGLIGYVLFVCLFVCFYFFYFCDLSYLGLSFMQNLCKRVIFLEILHT